MKFLRLVLLAVTLAAMTGCVGLSLEKRPPAVSLPGVKYTVKQYRATDLAYLEAPELTPVGTPTTVLDINDGNLIGTIQVRKVADGRQREKVPFAVNFGAYIDVRKRTKHFSWGEGQSCLAQFTQEAHGVSPNNDDLSYQVAGLTADRKYSIYCGFGIKHPRLPDEAGAKEFNSSNFDQLDSHADVRLIETAPDGQFRPSITRIDQVISSLVIRD